MHILSKGILPNLGRNKREYFSSEDLSDSELLDRMFDSANGHSIQRLFNGDIASYSSHSEADLAGLKKMKLKTSLKDCGQMALTLFLIYGI